MFDSGRSTMTPGCSTVWTNPAAPGVTPTFPLTGEPPPNPSDADGATPAVPPICRPVDTSDWQPS
jgi:hypothetical protein